MYVAFWTKQKIWNKQKIALIYDNEKYEDVISLKAKLMKNYNVSIYKRPKNLKALLEKLSYINFDGFAFYKDDVKDVEIKNI